MFSSKLLATIEKQYPGMQKQLAAKIKSMTPGERRMMARANAM